MADYKPILCLDFDGVLNQYTSGWKGADQIPDPPVPGAIAFLYEACCHFDVQIFSSRSNQPGGIDAMKRWISMHEHDWRSQQEAVPRTSLLFNIKFPTEKPPAMVGIDDRVITFTGTFPTMNELRSFKPWNKK